MLSGTITLVAHNDAPVIAYLHGDNGSYTEGGAALLVNQDTLATVSDADLSNFAGGSLSVAISAGGNIAQDVLGIHSATVTVGGGGIVAGAAVSVGGVQIGTIASVPRRVPSPPLAPISWSVRRAQTRSMVAAVRTVFAAGPVTTWWSTIVLNCASTAWLSPASASAVQGPSWWAA